MAASAHLGQRGGQALHLLLLRGSLRLALRLRAGLSGLASQEEHCLAILEQQQLGSAAMPSAINLGLQTDCKSINRS